MKKLYAFLIVAAICLPLSMLSAQQPLRIVTIPGFDPASGQSPLDFLDMVRIGIDADAPLRAENPNVIYELKRGHIYFMVSRINSNDYNLHIRAEEGNGPLPRMINWPTSTGTYQLFIFSYRNFTMENIHVETYTLDGGVGNRALQHYGNNSRVIYRGCLFDGDRGAAISLRADSLKLYVDDCVVGNQGHRKTMGGNGRLVDLRPEALTVDTIVIRNTTVYNISDRLIRNQGTVVNYIEIDHLTAVNIIGYHGVVQLGRAKNAIVKNSLFANTLLLGDHTANEEQLHPEGTFFVVTVDTIYDGGIYELRNNNVFWNQEVLNTLAAIDTVGVPGLANPTLLAAVGKTTEEAFFSENLVLANVCAPPVAFVAAYYANPAASEFPENWCVGYDDGIHPFNIDVSYDTESFSYTAADRSFPVGNLNDFPGLRALWEAGVDLNSEDVPLPQAQAIIAYPNPVRDVLYLNQEADEVIVYNILGKVVLSAQNVQSLNVRELTEGIYLLNVRKDNNYSVHKIIVRK